MRNNHLPSQPQGNPRVSIGPDGPRCRTYYQHIESGQWYKFQLAPKGLSAEQLGKIPRVNMVNSFNWPRRASMRNKKIDALAKKIEFQLAPKGLCAEHEVCGYIVKSQATSFNWPRRASVRNR